MIKWIKQFLDTVSAEQAYLEMLAHRDRLFKENIDLTVALTNCADQLQTFRGAGRLDEPSRQSTWTDLDEVRLSEARTVLSSQERGVQPLKPWPRDERRGDDIQ